MCERARVCVSEREGRREKEKEEGKEVGGGGQEGSRKGQGWKNSRQHVSTSPCTGADIDWDHKL